MSHRTDPFDRVMRRVEKRPDGCWVFTGARLKIGGYGIVNVGPGGQTARAHRLVYERIVGPIRSGWHLHHLCRNGSCVNPEHLQPISPSAHVLEHDTPPGLNKRKTHCPQGHAYDEANTGVAKGGKRYCRACCRIRANAYYHRVVKHR